MLGAILSASVAALGLTSFLGDYRGEWHVVVAPIGFAIALAFGIPAFWYLRKTAPLGRLLAFSGIVVLVSLAFYTWRFMAFAA
ncbi:MAG: hypothetical protein QM719_08380 [Thermomonas sp.]